MSEAFLCDECGDLVGGKPKTKLFNFNDLGEQEEATDFCENCSKEKGLT